MDTDRISFCLPIAISRFDDGCYESLLNRLYVMLDPRRSSITVTFDRYFPKIFDVDNLRRSYEYTKNIFWILSVFMEMPRRNDYDSFLDFFSSVAYSTAKAFTILLL
ncbi:hypothetical protein HZH66_004620 [Vespula vulgaris]|uniref:Uncharacterized protein n=1 Tax=Vespula vulgaris TaxID=7454 RepID=A0A834K8W0_VESVU|nr:hypothetical protein HZH66_004620 [Vespula vulgaris]